MRRLLVPLLLASLTVAACGETNSKSSASPTPSATNEQVAQPTPTVEVLAPPADIDTSGWQLYRDEAHGFELKYPPDARLTRDAPAEPGVRGNRPGVRVDLPKAPGTNLVGKYVFITVSERSVETCGPPGLGGTPVGAKPPQGVESVRYNGVDFWKEQILAGMMMHAWGGASYWASNGVSCVTMSTVLASISPSALSTPPPRFDMEEEAEIFPAIMSTFRWLDQ